MYRNRIINKSATKYFSKLYKFVTLKDCVSEYIWYMLVGSFVIVTSIMHYRKYHVRKTLQKCWHNMLNGMQMRMKIRTEPERRVYYTRE